MTQKANIHLPHLPTFVKFIVLFQLFTNLIVFLDVGVLRQIVGFIYLTFIPGMIFVKMFKWDNEGFSTTILFSVGLSIAFLMFIGFAMNELLPLMGYSAPLSILPLLVTMNLVVLLPCFLGYLKHAKVALRKGAIPYNLLLFFCLPLLAILGAFMVNASGNISLLLLMIALISALSVLVAIRERFLPSNLFPLALFGIALALLFHTSLIANYIVGWDVHSEYHVFKMTENVAQWTSGFYSWDDRIAKGNAMLSTTILPTIYSEALNMDGTWIFKIIYPLILAFVPFTLFKMYAAQTTKKAAFLSVFFFISSFSFFAADSFAFKQMVAQLFFVLLFMVILQERAGSFKREFFFVIFGFALVVSHYSTSYMFLFLIFLTWLFYAITRRPQKNGGVTLTEVLLFFTMAFSWYIYTSAAAPFDAILNTGGHIFATFTVDFFNVAARSAPVSMAFGGGTEASVWHQFGRVFFYMTEVFIVIGFLTLVLRRTNTSFSERFSLLSSFSMVILGMAVVLPNLAGSFRIERFYQISLLFLAPVCILGGETIFKFLLKRRGDVMALTLLLLVLIPNFLFQTGFVYAVRGDVTSSIPFGMSSNEDVRRLIIYEQEVRGAEWLSTYRHSLTVIADYYSAFHVLTSYGLLSSENFSLISAYPESMISARAYTYLNHENVVEGGTMVAENRTMTIDVSGTIVEQGLKGALVVVNASDYSSWLRYQNLIYSSGSSEIFISAEIPKNSTQQ